MVVVAETEKSFWQTVPGVITAVAALLTALGGLLGVLVQTGLIGGSDDEVPAGTTPVVAGAPGGASSGTEAGGTRPSGADASTLIPWVEASATLVRRDGTSAKVKAATVGLACDTGNLAFKNGQGVSLELVRSIDFSAVYTENASADGVVALLDGRQLTDPISTRNCPVSGTNDLGRVDIRLEDIDRIDFHR